MSFGSFRIFKDFKDLKDLWVIMWKSLYKFLVVGTGYDVGAQQLSPVVADDLRLQPHGLVALEAKLAVDVAVGAVARYDIAVQGLQVAHYLLAFLYRLAEPLLRFRRPR